MSHPPSSTARWAIRLVCMAILLADCSPGSSPAESAVPFDSESGRSLLAQARSRFPVLPGIAQFEDGDTRRRRAVIRRQAGNIKTATVEVPTRANRPVRIEDDASHAAIEFTL